MIILIAILAALGFAISLYGFIIEEKIKRDSSYKPVCDISDAMSCTKPMLSPWGSMLGFSNAIVGLAFYALVFVLALLQYNALIFYMSLASVGASIFLAYILYTQIKTLCLLCTSVYAINVALLVVSYLNL